MKSGQIDFAQVRKWKQEDLLKSMAFQLGQGLGLHQGAELYTKADIAAQIPQLRPYLYRQAADMEGLQSVCDAYLQILRQTEAEPLHDGLTRLSSGAVYDIHRERRLV